ncbi:MULTISPECIES: AraC family transcriptional regulator [Paraburkholderia]|uniref:Helix-turn-helix domain-containing protein n=2 Tax=Paraburkholderia madseniana TaxID=2599607 RepID=A0A6N6W193_9BURK|nr:MULTISPECIES: AraC family transcriptional regulator [Paraburkholderia]KAE8753889.1 helix-turn-helix domain-containing protein [Paraburkholderia madseniana]MCX4170085.1 helix-turn-helix domain-containing protein [Paraburkholderia madseniana]MDQ6458097.1 helix-turn-helix domain-containing protein [Paraburkholderia madseniana]NPT63802.1 helix-turn-helix domain-containing protein [Paraburkholderia madseniana]
MTHFVTVSTATIPPEGQAAEWARTISERFSECFDKQRRRTASGEPFTGRIGYARIGQIQLCRLAAQGHQVENAPRSSSIHASHYKITLQLEGHSDFEQDGLRARLSPGQWAIYDTARPYLMSAPHSIHVAIATIPKELVRLTLAERCALVQPLTSLSGAGRQLRQYIVDRLDELEISAGCDAVETAPSIEWELASQIKVALQDQIAETRRNLHPRMLRARIVEYIEQNLSDPELTVDRIAHDLHCSKRYLHTVFDTADNTLGRYILQLRLTNVCRAFSNPSLQQCSITELAMKWGFVSPGHFSRTFKETFGITPRDYRASVAQSIPAC